MGEKFGNAGALGLSAFGMSVMCLMVHNIGAIEMSSMILAMGMIYGGIIQIIVGAYEWKMGDTFGTVAFTSYGAFWIVFCIMQLMPSVGLGTAPSGDSVGVFLVVWTVFTAFLFVCTLRLVMVLRVAFAIALLGFPLLAIHAFFPDFEIVGTVAGYVGIVLGLVTLYGGQAQIVNELYGRELLPIGAEALKRERAAREAGAE